MSQTAKTRHQARRMAVQALYQWQMSDGDVRDILAQFAIRPNQPKHDDEYFADLVRGVTGGLDALDAVVAPKLSRPIEQVDPVERAILRLAAYELLHHPEVPYRVVLNEAVELAKVFGAEQGHRFVNGVVDKLAPELRVHEVQARAGT